MNIRGIVAGVVVGLIAGGSGLNATYAADNTPDLTCETVSDCHVVIDVIYDEAKTLSKSTADLEVIRERQARRIAALRAKVQRLKNR